GGCRGAGPAADILRLQLDESLQNIVAAGARLDRSASGLGWRRWCGQRDLGAVRIGDGGGRRSVGIGRLRGLGALALRIELGGEILRAIGRRGAVTAVVAAAALQRCGE